MRPYTSRRLMCLGDHMVNCLSPHAACQIASACRSTIFGWSLYGRNCRFDKLVLFRMVMITDPLLPLETMGGTSPWAGLREFSHCILYPVRFFTQQRNPDRPMAELRL